MVVGSVAQNFVIQLFGLLQASGLMMGDGGLQI